MRHHLLALTTATMTCTAAFLACGTTYAEPDDARPDMTAAADAPQVEGGTFPSGAVMFFDLATCPEGWTEMETARGRVVVGRTSGGLLGGTVGAALLDQGERRIDRVPAHAHMVDPPSVATSDGGAHVHGATVADAGAHTHTGTTGTSGNHSHNVDTGHGGGTQSIAQFAGTETDVGIADFQTSTTGSHSHSFTTGSSGNHTHGVTVATAGAHGHVVNVGPFMSSSAGDDSVDVTMPYVQLLTCRKS